MLILNNNYMHRFSNAKHVYCITNNNVLSIQQRTFYSVPYKPSEIDRRNYPMINNVIVAYVDEDLCSKHINILKNTVQKNICEISNVYNTNVYNTNVNKSIDNDNTNYNKLSIDIVNDNSLESDSIGDVDIIPFKLSMKELKQLSKFIGMPVAILLNEEVVDDKLVYNVYIDYMRGGGEEKDFYSI